MTSRKRFTKKEIKEDKLVTTAFKTSEYIQKNPAPFVFGGVVVAVIFAALLLFMWSADKKQAEATTLLARARLSMEAGQANVGITDLKALISDYAGTKQAGYGALRFANYYYQNDKDYDEALKYFEIVIADYPDDKVRLANAANGAASCYAHSGNFTEAAGLFEMSADVHPERSWAPGQMKQAIYHYIQAGDTAKAISVIKRLDSLYETSTESMAAQRILAEITY
ncbi:MAG: tetratricopeptide repeat protein [candidate division Zixibacteria bacterium]